jgi:LysR family transcriptional regulator, hydrogen peroxide-inducible genes activator
MNLQQIEYIIAIDETRHFAKAAKKCRVTQPSVSMMLQRLEEELQLKIFARTQKWVVPTNEGAEIIARAKVISAEMQSLKQYISNLVSAVCGKIKIGMIPSLAPYIRPVLVKKLMEQYQDTTIAVVEMSAGQIITEIKKGSLDMAVLANPLSDNQLVRYKLFDEELYVYASKEDKLPKDKYVYIDQFERHKLWLLKDDHSFRSQVLKICKLQEEEPTAPNLHYGAGSIDALVDMIDQNQGITIIPRLAVEGLSPVQKKNIREFAPPHPVREISLVMLNSYPRRKVVEVVKQVLLDNLAVGKPEVEKRVVQVTA